MRSAAPGDRSSNDVDVTAAAEQTDGQRDTPVRCGDCSTARQERRCSWPMYI